MKIKGKWAILAIALGLILAGCGGSSGSAEEGAVNAKDYPVLGTWLVTIDPQNNKVTISPVVTQEACTQGNMKNVPNCLHYSPITQITLTDMVVKSSETVTVQLNNTDWTNLGHGDIIPGSASVWKGLKSSPTATYVEGIDYNFLKADAVVIGSLGQIQRIATGSIVNGNTVNVEYGFGSAVTGTGGCPKYGLQNGNTFADCFQVGNYTANTLEKVRLWTGLVQGPGHSGTELLGDASTTVGRSDYPLLDQNIPANYEKPHASKTMALDGWTAGVCVTAWGQWNSFSPLSPPNVEGCTLTTHPSDTNTLYAPAWLDPACGRSYVEPWRFTGQSNRYWFYTQMSGNVIPWLPDYTKWPHGGDQWRANDYHDYSIWYLQMAYLVPDDPTLLGTWCNNGTTPATAKYWWAGSMVPIKYGSTKHCGTLITDPHLKRGTYFALNIALEYSDTIEKLGQQFWTDYKTNPNWNATQTHGAYYLRVFNTDFIYDNSKLINFPVTSQNYFLIRGTTMVPRGFVQNAVC